MQSVMHELFCGAQPSDHRLYEAGGMGYVFHHGILFRAAPVAAKTTGGTTVVERVPALRGEAARVRRKYWLDIPLGAYARGDVEVEPSCFRAVCRGVARQVGNACRDVCQPSQSGPAVPRPQQAVFGSVGGGGSGHLGPEPTIKEGAVEATRVGEAGPIVSALMVGAASAAAGRLVRSVPLPQPPPTAPRRVPEGAVDDEVASVGSVNSTVIKQALTMWPAPSAPPEETVEGQLQQLKLEVAQLRAQVVQLQGQANRGRVSEAKVSERLDSLGTPCGAQVTINVELLDGTRTHVTGVRVPDVDKRQVILTCAHKVARALACKRVKRVVLVGTSGTSDVKDVNGIETRVDVQPGRWPTEVSPVDLALLIFPPKTVVPATILKNNAWVRHSEDPVYVGKTAKERVAKGQVSGYLRGEGLCVHDCNTEPGQSGSPVCCMRNGAVQVVGIHLGTCDDGKGEVNVFVPTQFVLRFMRGVGVGPHIVPFHRASEGFVAKNAAVSSGKHIQDLDDDDYDEAKREAKKLADEEQEDEKRRLDEEDMKDQLQWMLQGGGHLDEITRARARKPVYSGREPKGRSWADMSGEAARGPPGLSVSPDFAQALAKAILEQMALASQPGGATTAVPPADGAVAGGATGDASAPNNAADRPKTKYRPKKKKVAQAADLWVTDLEDIEDDGNYNVASVLEAILSRDTPFSRDCWATRLGQCKTHARLSAVAESDHPDCGGWALDVCYGESIEALLAKPEFAMYTAADYWGSDAFADFRAYCGLARFSVPEDVARGGVTEYAAFRACGKYDCQRPRPSRDHISAECLAAVEGVLGKKLEYGMPPTEPEAVLRSLEFQLGRREANDLTCVNPTGVRFWARAVPSWSNSCVRGPVVETVNRFLDSTDPRASAGWTQFMPGGVRGPDKGSFTSTTEGRSRVCYMALCRLILLLATPPQELGYCSPSALVERGYMDPELPFVKGEPHSNKKLAQGRVRLIWCASLVDLVVQALLAKDFSREAQRQYEGHCEGEGAPLLAVGLGHDDAGVQHFASIIRDLEDARGRVWSSDAEGFDVRVVRDAQVLAYAVRADALDLCCGRGEQFWSPPVGIRAGLNRGLINLGLLQSAHVMGVDGRLYEPFEFGVVGSGILFTGPDDGLVRSLVYYSAAASCKLDEFKEAVCASWPMPAVLCVCNGDDMLGTIALGEDGVNHMKALGVHTKEGASTQDLFSGVEYTSHVFHYTAWGADAFLGRVGLTGPKSVVSSVARFVGYGGPVVAEFQNLEKSSVNLAVRATTGKRFWEAVEGIRVAVRHSACREQFERVVDALTPLLP